MQPFVIRCLGAPLSKPNETRLQYDFPPRGSAYFVVEPKGDCVEIPPVDAKAAAPLLRTTRYRAIGTVNPLAQATGDAPAVFGPALPAGAAAATVAAAPGANEQIAAASAAWPRRRYHTPGTAASAVHSWLANPLTHS